MPQERLPKQALLAKANGRRAVGRPRTRWTDYIEDLGWNRLGLRPSEMMEVMEDREVWRLNLELLPWASARGGRGGPWPPPGFSHTLSKSSQISKILPFLVVNTGSILIGPPPLKIFLPTPLATAPATLTEKRAMKNKRILFA